MGLAHAPLPIRQTAVEVYVRQYVNACRAASNATSEADVLFWKEQAKYAYATMVYLGWTPEGIV